METIYSFFDNNGVPVLGLTPTVQAVSGANGEPLFSGGMTEVGGGWYKCKIDKYDKTVTYLVTVDGGASLPNGDRYQTTVNELDSYPNKLDWRSISTWTINNDEIAKAVWDYKNTKPKEGSMASLISKDVDYNIIALQFEDIKKELAKIDLSTIKIPEMKEGLCIEDIEKIIQKYDNKDELSKIIGSIKSIIEVSNIIKGECIEIKDFMEKFASDDMEDTKEELGLNAINDGIDKIIKGISRFDIVSEKLEDLPELVLNYKAILNIINDKGKMEDKLTSIRMGVNDILSKIK